MGKTAIFEDNTCEIARQIIDKYNEERKVQANPSGSFISESKKKESGYKLTHSQSDSEPDSEEEVASMQAKPLNCENSPWLNSEQDTHTLCESTNSLMFRFGRVKLEDNQAQIVSFKAEAKIVDDHIHFTSKRILARSR